jgi:hypothetical protein
MFHDLLVALKNPDSLHILLESGIGWAILLSTLFYALSLFLLKDKKSLVASLILLTLAALMVLPAAQARDAAKPIGSPSVAELKRQDERRKSHAWVFYSLAGLAAATVVFGGPAGGKAATMLRYAVLPAGLGAAAVALWLHYKEAQIFYPDLQKRAQILRERPDAGTEGLFAKRFALTGPDGSWQS